MLKLGAYGDWAGGQSRQGELTNERSSAEGYGRWSQSALLRR